MEKTIAERLTDIFGPDIDENGCISLDAAEQLVNEAAFDISETGFDNLTEMLEELRGQFNVDTSRQPAVIQCLLAKKETDTTATNKTMSSKLKNNLQFRIFKSLEALSYRNPQMKGCIPLSLLEQKLAQYDVNDFGGMTLAEFIQSNPKNVELVTVNDETCAKLEFHKARETEPKAKAGSPTPAVTVPAPATAQAESVRKDTSAKQAPQEKRFISSFKLFDFAFFPNYRKALMRLVEMSKPDGWFVLSETGEPDPYYLVDLCLRTNFAHTVQKAIDGQDDGMHISLMAADVDTGFLNEEGKRIFAHFGVNRKRDTENCQSWYFQHFHVEGEDVQDTASSQEENLHEEE